MNFSKDKVVILFYKDFERDSFFKHDRYVKRLIRPAYNFFKTSQKVSGFFVWYQLLVKALRQQGYDVRLNDYALARRNPKYPVGLVGYPHLLDGWQLPNPAILGPSLFDHPNQAPDLLADDRYKYYIVTCQWMKDVFTQRYGSQCVMWHAGIDLNEWEDTRSDHKTVDVLIYDKVRWDRDLYEPNMIKPMVSHLDGLGLTHSTIRYGQYDHAAYKAALKRSKSMIFLCEHETQGMAYQEALASNVPILAWEQGFWLDPGRKKYSSEPILASSVPYFSPECGERFVGIDDFYDTFKRFWAHAGRYEPREFVRRELSLQSSADIYTRHYADMANRST
jgi:hypothetical protein